jgi:hypothetical protein
MKTAIYLILVLAVSSVARAQDCFPECNDDYDEWVLVGEPNS